MPDYRVQYLFMSISDTKANGWTENFYATGASAAGLLSNVGSPANVALRRAVMGADFRMSSIRVVNVRDRNDSRQIDLQLSEGKGTFTTGPSEKYNSEQPWDALLWRLLSQGGFRRAYLMRGIPTGVFQDTMAVNPEPGSVAYLTNLQNFGLYLGGSGHPSIFTLRHYTYGPVISPTAQVLLNHDQFQFTIAGAIPVGIVRGTLIQVRNMRGVAPRPNHNWRVQSANVAGGNYILTTFPARQFYAGDPDGPTELRVATATYDALGAASYVRATKRNTGRPPDVLRSRSLTRRR